MHVCTHTYIHVYIADEQTHQTYSASQHIHTYIHTYIQVYIADEQTHQTYSYSQHIYTYIHTYMYTLQMSKRIRPIAIVNMGETRADALAHPLLRISSNISNVIHAVSHALTSAK